MKYFRHTLCLLMIFFCSCINGPDPFDPLNEFHVQNMTDDSIVCQYHCVSKSVSNANVIKLASGEQGILYRQEENDTLYNSGLPHYNFVDMLFASMNGDTLLYMNPIIDSMWIQYDTTFYHNVYGGHRWIYKFYKQ